MDSGGRQEIAALSARLAALELGLAAIAQSGSIDHKSALQNFDLMAETLMSRYLATALPESDLDVLRSALTDIRKMLDEGP